MNDPYMEKAIELNDRLVQAMTGAPSRMVAVVCLSRAAKIYEAMLAAKMITPDEVAMIFDAALTGALDVRSPDAEQPKVEYTTFDGDVIPKKLN